MKIASWNVNSLNVRLPHLQQWLRDAQPDVVGIQETKLEDARFPDSALAALGYRSVFAGQKTYNGVALLSREPAQDVQIGIPGFEDEQKRVIAATVDGVRVGLIARYADDLPALSDEVRDIVDDVLLDTLGSESSAAARHNISVRWQDVYTREWLSR